MKAFLITVDTEGDNLWKWKEGTTITTENTRFIPRFQEMCEEFGFKPVYLTNYEMAQDKEWVNYAKIKAQHGMCEIGMHIHAWNSPPDYKLNKRYDGNPYITEYPAEIVYEKINFITKFLQERFEIPMRVARSGRWATNEIYFEALKTMGYIGDCSYAPAIDFSIIPGYSAYGGNDYRKVSRSVHLLPCGVVEVPMTTRKIHHVAEGSLKHKLSTVIKGDCMWLRPYRKSLSELWFLSEVVKKEGQDYLEFMIHSSELMPGGSPYFKTDEEVEILFSIMKEYFAWLKDHGWKGTTLSDYIVEWKKYNV